MYTTKKIKRVFSDDQFKLQELQTRIKCFLVCFAKVCFVIIHVNDLALVLFVLFHFGY